MPRERLPRNAPCPCGSGKKYKKCCYTKGFQWVEDEGGGVARSIPMSEDLVEVFQRLRQDFIDRYGREPGPEDRLFPDLPHPEHLEALMAEGMRAAGLDPALIHAFEQAGLLVTEQNRHLIPDKDLDAWQAAIEAYEAQHARQQSPPEFPLGTVALYGPDESTTTKIVAGVIPAQTAEPILRRWVATDVTTNLKIQREIREFFAEHQVKSVVASEGNLGCPHEEGEDCPFCPYWKGKQGSNRQL